MPLQIPQIDDRKYQDFLQEALARIRVTTPEWTNFNESDPGVTLLELFAFMSESLLYRANLIPERNRAKFLSLLGIPMQPAAAARGIATIQNERGPLQTVTLSPDLEVRAGSVPFRTLNGLDVLPVEARVYYKRPLPDEQTEEVRDLYTKLYGSHTESGDLRFYETTLLKPPVDATDIPTVDLGKETLDGALWIALLSRPKERPQDVRPVIAGKVLNLGVLPALSGEARVLRPLRTPAQQARVDLIFELASDDVDAATELPLYSRLETRLDTDILSEPGIVKIMLPAEADLQLWDTGEPLQAGTGDYPPSLEDTRDEERLITWIRIRLPEEQLGAGLSAKFSWLGINAALITQRTHVAAELLGQSTGEPDQSYTLVNKPVIPGTVRLTVNGAPWAEIDDLLAAGPEVPVKDRRRPPGAPQPADRPARVFALDPEAGTVRFGDGARGARPPAGAEIRASYDYGGGREGNVGIGAVSKAGYLPGGLKVNNPLPTWGGDEAESVADAEQKIARYLQHRDRLVTQEDFREIAKRTPGVDIGRVELLPLFNPTVPEVAFPGMVTLMVIPRHDVAHPEAPLPDKLFLDLVCAHINPRRLVTTEVHVRGPLYKKLYVSVGIEPVPGRDFPPVREAVNKALRTFLSPLTGGRDGQGWPLEKAVLAKELWAEAARVEGVAFVREVQLGGEVGGHQEQIAMAGLELPWLVKVDAREGDPEPLEQIRDRTSVPGEGQSRKQIVPIPVIPDKC